MCRTRRAVVTELKRADIVCTCTTNATPLFTVTDLRADVHINAIGSYRPATREIGSDVVSKAAIIVDSYEAALKEPGDIVTTLSELGEKHEKPQSKARASADRSVLGA